VDSFEDATRRPYGYLLIDLCPNTPEEIRLRTSDVDKQNFVCLSNGWSEGK